MTDKSSDRRRPVAVVPTAGKIREQMKADARRALAELLTNADDSETEADS